MSHNTKDQNACWRQWGGTGILTYGKLAHFAAGAGSDKAKLGRWTWAKYRGTNGVMLRVVSIYRPCSSRKHGGSVYAQQKTALKNVKDYRDPIVAWQEDFEQELQEWIAAGDQVIVQGDINESVFHQNIESLFQRHSMRNLIFDIHDRQNAPTTYYRNTQNKIIDGIWATPGIKAEQGGYLEPGDFPGDHSMVWVDITYNSALGHNPPQPTDPEARRLKLEDSRTTKRYLDLYGKYVEQHRLLPRQRRLNAAIQYGRKLTRRQAQEADAIDALKTKLMLRAESKCRKLRMGAIAFSEATAQPRRQIQFWSLAIRRRLGVPVSSKLWRRKKKKANIEEPTRDMSIEMMRQKLKEAKLAYREAKKNHKALRQTFIESFAPKDRDRIKRTEEQRHLGRISKMVTGKLASKSVTKIEIAGRECTSKADIEAELLRVNEAKVHASDSTPFLQQPLLQHFGYRNETVASDAVLNGTFHPPEGTDQHAALLIQHLKRPLNPLAPEFVPRRSITVEDHIRCWKKAKERTAAGMSGLTFAMFKANIKDPTLAELDALQRTLAYETGHSFLRWKSGVDVQLLKRKKDYRAEKLRTILLLEADFNMNNKVMGSDMMRYGARTNTLARDNYGGKKHSQSVEVALNAQLTYNSIWARRSRAIIMSNDAKGCYDRIAHVVVSLAMQRFQIPKPALSSMLETIQEMDHYVRTAFGISEGSYGNSDIPPSGILQGNGAGPAGWFAISTVLIQAMKEANFGYKQWTIIKQKAVQLSCFAFVDDTDLIHSTNDTSVSSEALIQESQQALNTWAGLLTASGGDLAPEKSYWYFLDIEYKNGSWRYKQAADNPGDLFLKGNYRIKRCEPHQANEALGIQMRPDGKMKDEVEYLHSKAVEWSDAIRTKKISKYEAWYTLTSTIMNTIEYPLTATSFSRKEVDHIMRPVLKAALPMCGIQRRMPRALVYGSLRSQCIQLKDPYWTQLIRHLQSIMMHQQLDTPTNELQNENMELVQLYIGSDQNFWDLPFQLYGPLAPDGWIKSTWQALSETSLSFRWPSLAIKPKRRRDVFLMDAFMAINPPPHDLQSLQTCRLYLQATTLADITTACGNRIASATFQGTDQPLLHQRAWIPTQKPTQNDWVIWQSYLRQCFLYPHTTHTRLRRPLGPWEESTDKQWLWWIDEATDTLYERRKDNNADPTSNHAWKTWQRRFTGSSQGNRRRYHSPQASAAGPPQHAIRVDTSYNADKTVTTIVSTSPPNLHQPNNPATTLEERLHRLPKEALWATDKLHRKDDGDSFAEAIRQNKAIIVSDGSLKYGLGTAAFILEGIDTNIIGVNEVPGPISEGDSLRCELSGLYGAILLANEIAALHNISMGKVTIACDNTTAISIFDPEFVPKPKSKNFDLIQAVYTAKNQSPFQWLPKHVKGHQDTKNPFKQLTHLEHLNVCMDAMAKRYWRFLVKQSPTFPTPINRQIWGEGWQIWNGDTKITRPNTNNLYSVIQTPITTAWWIRHKVYTEEASQLIDYDATERLMHKLPFSRRRWIMKHASENCGVGATLLKWEYQTDAKCPRCNHPAEDTRHVLLCQGTDANEVFQQSIDTLKTTMEAIDTDPDILHTIVRCLGAWRSQQRVYLTDTPPEIRRAALDQQKIGWKRFLEGLPSRKWQTLQHRYYSLHSIRKSSKKWIDTLLHQLHHLAWNQWNHRNDVKHRLSKPRERMAMRMLDQEIIRMYTNGLLQLLPGDRYHLEFNLAHLLKRPVNYKKSWLLNVIAAQKHYMRIRAEADEVHQQSRDLSWILRWIQGQQI